MAACQNEACQLYEDENSLCANHSRTEITLYFLEGPRAGVKHSLKCKSCEWIYNYSKYGKKKTIGEKFYDRGREFIEVSDTVFCSRKLHEMYCNLK